MYEPITITEGRPAMAFPLFVVVVVQMFKDAWEDWQRSKSDKEENNNTTKVVHGNDEETPRAW